MEPNRPRPLSRAELLLAFGLAVFAFLGGFFHVSDADVGYHMRTAEHILAGQGIPTTNTFSYTTPEEPWLLHQWLGTLVFHAPYRMAGLTGLIAFKAAVAAAMLLLVWATARRLTGGTSWWPFWAVTLGLVIARVRFFERSDLFSAFFCTLLLYLDTRLDRNRRWQWIGLPLLMAVWANVHAGAVYGLVLLVVWAGAEWAGWIAQRLGWKAIAAPEPAPVGKLDWAVRPLGILLSVGLAVATVQAVNPNGAQVLWFPISQFGDPFWQSVIVEYFSPKWDGNRLFYLTLGGIALLQLLTWRQIPLRWLLSTAAFGYLACGSQRSILFFVLLAVPHLALLLERLLPSGGVRWCGVHRLGLPLAWAALVVGVFVRDPVLKFGPGLHPAFYPMGLYEFLASRVPEQRLFNDMRFGGSMQWFTYPKFKPFIDGRGDAFSVAFWQKEYLPIRNAEAGWTEGLARHGATGVLLPCSIGNKASKLAEELRRTTNWALVAFDDRAMLFLERTEANVGVIAANEFRHFWPAELAFGALDQAETRPAATAEAQRLLALAPEGVFARLAGARAGLVNGRFEEAATLYAALERDGHDSANILRDHAFALMRSERWAEADQVLGRMVRENKLPGYARYLQHRVALGRNDPAGALRHLREAVALEPGNAEYREALSRLESAPAQP